MSASTDQEYSASAGHRVDDSYYSEDASAGIFHVSRRTFTDPQIFERERRKIFDRCWLYAGHETEIPGNGDFFTRMVGGRNLIVVRGKDGRVRALFNTCLHRGMVVCRETKGNAQLFRCFYHSWTYDNQGRLVGVPGQDAYGPAFQRGEKGLVEARLESYRGLIFVCYAQAQPVTLLEYLAGAREILDLIIDQGDGQGLGVLSGSHDYGIRANWKLLMENTLDGYHLFSTHARFMNDYMPKVMGVTPSRKNYERGTVLSLGNGHSAMEFPRFSPSPDEDKRAQWEARFGKQHTDRMLGNIRQLLLFPNTLFIEIFQAIRTCYPVAPDEMQVRAWPFMPVTDDPNIRRKRLDVYTAFLGPGGFSTPDDIEALELCQEGYSSAPEVPTIDVSRGMLRDIPLPDDEHQMRIFWRHWQKLVRA